MATPTTPTRLTGPRRAFVVSLVVVLLVLLCLQLVVLPRAAESVVAQLPEVAYLQTPAVIWEIGTTLLLEVVVVILTYLAASRARRSTASLRTWVAVILVALAALSASLLVALGFLGSTSFATPGVMLALLSGLGVAAVGIAVARYKLDNYADDDELDAAQVQRDHAQLLRQTVSIEHTR